MHLLNFSQKTSDKPVVKSLQSGTWLYWSWSETPIFHTNCICLGTWSKNYWADREKVWFFLNLIFSAVRNFKSCRNKKFCSVKITFSCTFAVIQILDNIGSIPFISWAISMKLSGYYFFMSIYTCAKLRSKISPQKIRHFWQAPSINW
jgi:hypothetical protein